MNGGVPSKGLNEKLRDILNELASNSDLLDNPNNIEYIASLLEIGANPSTKGQDGKTLSDYSSEKLRDILNELASNSDLLDNSNYTRYIMFLLQAGANRDTQNQDGKTLLHYVAERNDTYGIEFLLKTGANSNVQDLSGKTPFEYVTEYNCLQTLKCRGYHSDDSHENEGNPATPDSSVGERNDCSNSSGDDNKTISTEPSDCAPEDEDSSCSSSDYLFLEDSLLAKLEIPLTTDERELIDKFCKEIRGITEQESEESILESIEKIVNEYLEEGIRLNSSCSNDNDNGDKETVTNLIFKEMAEVIDQFHVSPRNLTIIRDPCNYDDPEGGDGKECQALDTIIKEITSSLMLKGGIEKKLPFYGDLASNHYDYDYLNDLNEKCEEIESKLISIACEGIVNKNEQAQKGEPEEVDIDNIYFYIKYPQGSIIEPVKILNHEKAKELNLKVGILQIGESIVRVEGTKDGKRNYTDIFEGSIEMSFTTEVGEINIYLSPSKEGDNKIEVQVDEESESRLNKLKAEKKNLGENCLLGRKSVLEAIEDKGFKKNSNVPTESIEITKGVPFTDFTQACLQQINTSVKGRQ